MIYLDNSATTALDGRVLEAMLPFLTSEYGNPSSKYYSLATTAQKAVANAREQVAGLIGAKPEEIIFTSGATESNNTIIKGVADYRKHYENRGNHLITSIAEHHAVLNTCRFLNGEIYSNHDAVFSLSGDIRKVDRGYKVDFLPVNSYGQVELPVFEKSIKPTTTLASIIWANNEVGSLNPVNTLGLKAKTADVFFHSDATQVLSKMEIDVSVLSVDALSFSAHKLNGPKGVGALYVRADSYGLPPFTSFMHGGEQENGVRAGTLCVHNIVGFGKAAELAKERFTKEHTVCKKKDAEIYTFLKKTEWIDVLGDPINRLPGIFNIVVNLPNFNNELFIKHICAEIAVSTGSACTLGEPSHVLKSMGFGDKTGRVLRVSVTAGFEIADIQRLLQEIKLFAKY